MEKPKVMSLPAYVSEMAGNDELKIEVPLAKGVKLAELTKGDSDPMFVVVEAVTEGESKNKRYYDRDTLKSIAEQINKLKPDAYDGHMRDEDRPFKRPQAKTIWVGAKIFEIDGTWRLFVKGYVLPYANDLKTYLQAAKAVGKQVAVSIFGQAYEIADKISNVKKVKDFILESIDWARTGSAGMNALGYLGLASEMVENETQVSNGNDWLTVIETYEGLKTGVEETVKESFVSPELVTVSEMLGVETSKVGEKVNEMKTTIKEMESELTDHFIETELGNFSYPNKIKTFVKTLVVAEMKSGAYNRGRAKQVIAETLNSESVKSLVSEMSRTLGINPVDSPSTGQDRKYTTL